MTQETIGFVAPGIHPNVLAAIVTIDHEEPSPIQAQSIPLTLEGHDMIGQAQTGTGKTAVFALSLLSRIDPSRREPQMLVLVPIRELAPQVATAYEAYSRQLPGVGVAIVYDGAPMGPQLKALRQGARILVATLDRLCDHLCCGEKLLATVQCLVFDEADEMLKLGFMDDLEVIFEALPESRQTVLFPATLPASIRGIVGRHLRQSKHVRIAAKTQTVAHIEQVHLMVHANQKVGPIQRLLKVGQFDALIAFVRIKQAALDYAELLERQDYHVAVFNGDTPRAQRERVIKSLKDGSLNIVITAGVAIRGLDAPRTTHVLNIDMPYDPESYVHRIGCIGRAGREGRALLLVTPCERRMLQVIERVIGQKAGEVRLPDAETMPEAHLARLAVSLIPLLNSAVEQRGTVRDELCHRLGCDAETLAVALLARLIAGKALDLESVRREQLLTPSAPRECAGRDECGERPERNGERRPMAPPSESRACCRTTLGARDGIAAKNLLGAILNESGLSREDIGRTQIRDTLSLIELPEASLECLLAKLRDTRVVGKALCLCRYRED